MRADRKRPDDARRGGMVVSNARSTEFTDWAFLKKTGNVRVQYYNYRPLWDSIGKSIALWPRGFARFPASVSKRFPDSTESHGHSTRLGVNVVENILQLQVLKRLCDLAMGIQNGGRVTNR